MSGKVYLVGAGPGDPKLITVRGMEAIAAADVVVYDRLASPRLLRHMKPSAEKIYVGKLPDRHTLKQEEINELLVRLATEGKTVTRLKGGDPSVFGRVGEEALALAEHGLAFEMVPGVTSALAVPAYAGIPVTHRGLTSSFAVVTGHECPKKDDSDIDWKKLATATGTLIFLMGVKNLQSICAQMMACGRSPETPVAVIEWGTCSDQRTVTGSLQTIVKQVSEAQIGPPAITIIGEVVGLREQLAWFEKKPLFGQKVVVTRARDQASELVAKIEELGGEALEFPVIRTQPVGDAAAGARVRTALQAIGSYDWLVFTSVNGVEYFFAEMIQAGIDIRAIRARLAAVGEKTAAALQGRGLQVALMPAEQYDGDQLAAALLETTSAEASDEHLRDLSAQPTRVLLARARTASPSLPAKLGQAGFVVDDVAFYETLPAPPEQQDEYALQQLLSGQATAITFTSSSTVHYFLQAMRPYKWQPPANCKLVCIGPVTAQTAREAGLRVTEVARQATIESLVQTLLTEQVISG